MTKKSEQLNLQKRLAGVTMPITRKRIKWGRNWLCMCGSGAKYKNCCLEETDNLTASDSNANVELLPEDIQKMLETLKVSQEKKKWIRRH